jgi:acyl carrier protein
MNEKLSRLIDQIAEQFDEGLNVEKNNITEDTPFRDTVDWDSMGALCVIAVLEDNYGISVTGMQMKNELNTFKDLINLIESN